MIKAVFFDYDGVLTKDKTGSLTTIRYLSSTLNVDFDLVKEAFAALNDDLTLGRTTHAAIWPRICQAVGRTISIELLREAFESTPVNEGMFSIARRLGKNLCVGIITDNKSDRIAHLRKYQDLDTLFDPIVVSADIGASKDGPEIFAYALARLGVQPQESIFIDNQRKNLVAPGAMGMKTLFHDDEQNDIAKLSQRLEVIISGFASEA